MTLVDLETILSNSNVRAISGALLNGAIWYSVNQFFYNYRNSNPEIQDRIIKAQQEAEYELEHANPEVRHFILKILHTARKLVGSIDERTLKLGTLAFVAGYLVQNHLFRNQTQLANRLTGSIAGVTSTIVDVASTYICLKATSDSRFHEYGLSNYIFESNPYLPPRPSSRDLVRCVFVFGGLSAILGQLTPDYMRSHLVARATAVLNNLQMARVFRKCYELGDEVKSMIDRGADVQQIEEYIVNQTN